MAPAFDPSAAARPGSGLFGLDGPPEEAAVHVLGVPFDATTSFRRGAAAGPAAVLAASHQVDLFDLLTGKPYEGGIWMAPLDDELCAWNDEAARHAELVIAAGGLDNDPSLAGAVERVDELQARVNGRVADWTRSALAAGKLPALVGGDHSVPLGAITAAAEAHPGLGILHVDAHADLRVAYEGFRYSHASILHNVLAEVDTVERVLQVGIRDLCEEEHEAIRASEGRVHTVFDHDWSAARHEGRLVDTVRRALDVLPADVWITFDVDGLDPTLCPNTGTPVPGGLLWDEAMLLLRELAASGRRVVGFDLNEVAPEPGREPGTGWDEIVGARLLYRLIGFARKGRT